MGDSTFSIYSSTIYQSSDSAEIHLNILLNTFGGCDEEELSKEIIAEYQKINGVKKNVRYMFTLYRTLFHYRRNWKYDTIVCDENGAIICCKGDLGV